MINVYDIGNTAFDNNGDAVLTPISCTVRQIAGGNYELTMTHPIDEAGKWAHLVPDAIVKAPIPAETITNAYTGLEADVYVTTEAAVLRSGPSEPTPITYGEWSPYADYQVGSRVTTSGWSHKNWVCTQWDPDSQTRMAPPYNSSWWAPVPDMTSGSPALANLKAGMELYYVSGPTDGWYKMSTKFGLEGYVKTSQVQYDRHVTPEETKPRTITTQLFRIRTAQVETKSRQITVNAQHVSYDLNGVMMEDVEIVRQPPAMSIAILEASYMIDYQGMIATDMVSNEDTDYSAKISGKNGMFALLDPDQGIVPRFDAEFRRDNWDLFIMAKKNEDRGFRLVYGKNLRGVNWNVKGDQLITRIVPVAKDEDGSDLFLTPVKWVDSQRISYYPVIRMERLKVQGQVGKDDGSETGTNWTAETLRAEMQKQAEARYTVDKIDQLQHEITIDFEMLGDTDEYRPLKKIQSVILYDTVIVMDPRIDLSVSVTVTEIEFDCIKEKITAVKLSNVNAYNVKNVSGFNVLNNTITGDKLTDDAGDEIMEEAVEESADYTDRKATQTLQSSMQYTDEYVGSKHSYSSFESYIKAYCDQTYVKK